MKWIGQILFVVINALLYSQATAQEHPFLIRYELTELSGGISIEWTMQGGSTCNGQDVERSTNGVDFVPVHRILGICGDPTVAVPFSWLDDAPPEFSTVYYRLKLGIDGYSSVQKVEYDQLETSAQRFFPSPVLDAATLLLNVPTGDRVDLLIWGPSGRLIRDRRNLTGARIALDLSDLPAGVYNYKASSGDKLFSGRFVKL